MLTPTLAAPRAPSPTEAENDAWFSRWRSRELGRLDRTGLTYLDYAGAALHPASLIRAEADRLDEAVLGNPHSEHDASRRATRDVEAARHAILEYLRADPDEYGVVLTQNTSGACRLVGESFPWSAATPFVLSADNHNSVNGLGEFAARGGAPVRTIALDRELRLVDPEAALEAGGGGGLFAYPAQSNFSGVRHPLGLVKRARELGYQILLDAAGYVPTSRLDLTEVRPDFLVLSIYKIAGYPAGVGALVARHEALRRLRRPWFAGGTVDWVSIGLGRHQLRNGVERFEDGTPAFLVAGAVPAALDAVTAADRSRLEQQLGALTGRLLQGLAAIRHPNGRAAIRVHGPATTRDRGATVAFTVETRTGGALPYWEVEEIARGAGLAVRGGCFCNPGCAEWAFGMHGPVIEPCLDRLGGDFTVPALARCLDGPVGAVRISLGLGSVRADVDRALAVLGGLAADAA